MFKDEEHEKAWLIKIATNVCKDKYRFNKRHRFINLEDISEYCSDESDVTILEDVLNLPNKYVPSQ